MVPTVAMSGVSLYHAQLELQDRGRAIKGLVVYRANGCGVCFKVRR